MIWKLNHGCHRSNYQLTDHASHRLSHDLCRGPVQRPRNAHIEAMCGWSMSLTGIGVAKLRAAVRAMLKQYDGAGIEVATRCRITSLARRPQKTNCDSPRYSADSRYIQNITARPGLLSVTESVALPPQPKGRSYAKTLRIQSS
jgi:hypothetical protein